MGKRCPLLKNIFNPKLSTKTNCQAKINVIIGNDGLSTISPVDLVHNHALNLQKSHFQKCHNKINAYVMRRLELNDQVGITLSKTFHSLKLWIWKFNLCCKEYQNYIAKTPQFRLRVKDVEALVKYLPRMQRRNSKFVSSN